jgi:hypothetical protein
LARPNLGVVVRSFDTPEYRRAARALVRLLDDPATRGLCREFAERELSLGQIGGPRYASVYGRLLADTQKDSVAISER